MKHVSASIIAAAAVFLTGSVVTASMIPHSDTISAQTATWATNPQFLTIALFDPSLGTLTQVQVTFTGTVSGSAAAENTDATSKSLTIQLLAQLSTDPDPAGLSYFVEALVENVFDATGWDGVTDYGGASGVLSRPPL